MLHAAALLCACICGLAASVAASAADEVFPEPWSSGWSLYVDNDGLLPRGRDEAYTGGVALTLSGRRVTRSPWTPYPLLRTINRWTGIEGLGMSGRHVVRNSVHLGGAAFTPKDVDSRAPVPGDRPYASLLFVSSTRRVVALDDRTGYQSSLALGMLGTNIVPAVANAVHEATGHVEVRGWDNQIADAGEPTANYVLQRYDTIVLHRQPGGGDYQVQTSVGGSVGFATHLSAGIGVRWGQFDSPWWAFTPDFAEYISLGTPLSGRLGSVPAGTDYFVWGGIDARYVLYNALLEGQFRESALTYDRDELRSGLLELGLGVTVGDAASGTYLTLALRARTRELRSGDADAPLWAGIVVSRAY